MGAVDISDQLRAVYYTQQQSVHNWQPYFFYFLNVAICNSYLLWKWYCESLSINDGRDSRKLSSHRFYRESFVEALIEGTLIQYEHIIITKHPKFIRPNANTIPIRYHPNGAKTQLLMYINTNYLLDLCILLGLFDRGY
jgi:hypothetical protein